MSHLWSDQLRIGFAPRRVELARIARGLRRPLQVAESVRDCAIDPGQPAWAGALDALDLLLAEQAPGRAEVSVVLSNHFVRYLVLPWQAELSAPAELAVAAAQAFERSFGEVARGWEVRYSQGEYGEAGIACAIESELLAGLGERLNRAGLRLVAVQPLLMSAFNVLRGQLEADGALAVVEAGRVCLGVFRQGQWQSVVSRRSGSSDPARVVEQELALAAADSAPTRLDLLSFGVESAWADLEDLPVRLHSLPEGQQCALARYGSA